MKIPEYFEKYHADIVNSMHDISIVEKYNVYHDCGKPYCIEYDENGKKHFPNHANVSSKVWSSLFPEDKTVTRLIGLDMVLHTATADEIKAMNLSKADLCTLMITALAEIHSNADMFGGTDSTSFKIKWKKLDKRIKMITKELFEAEHKYSYVIVRNDLSNAQKAIQGTHASIEAKHDVHPSVIYIVAKNELKLKKIIKSLIDLKIKFFIFREPDLNNSITVIATEPLIGDQREYFKRFQLMK